MVWALLVLLVLLVALPLTGLPTNNSWGRHGEKERKSERKGNGMQEGKKQYEETEQKRKIKWKESKSLT